MRQVLIINQKIEEAEEIAHNLGETKAEITCVSSIHEALCQFIQKEFSLVILDSNISIEDDFQLLKVMRSSKSTPILVLSSHADHTDRLKAFQAGAHAYMGKPFTLEECLAQAESLMKHYVELHPADKICYTLAFGKDLVIDPNARKVYLKGRELSLTKKEFDLLFCLASNPGKVFSREQLYDHVWDDTSAYNVSGVVKTHISSLRQKMVGADAEYIKNIWGVGYKFEK